VALRQEIFERVFLNWKSTVRGTLTVVLVLCGVLSAQGVTLGHAGTGTVVTLIAALALALEGMLRKDK
jgi:hypothetical protein